MTAFENAKQFFTLCEASEGWEACEPFVAPGASFSAQSEPLTGISTVAEYCDWMKAIGRVTLPGATYDLHSASYDDDSKTALFFATFHAKHTGEGGPVPPTNKETHTDYVYALKMDEDGKVARMTKVWNAPWALKELGWM